MEKLETLAPNTQVGPFRVIRPINETGGMATVYVAEVREHYRHHGLPTQVVLKVARAQYEDFLKIEADTLANLAGHPHIVRVYPLPVSGYLIYWTTDSVRIDMGRREKLCFMATEYVGGGSLRRMMESHGGRPLPSDVVTGIARQIAAGLEHAHQSRIVHLDIKPENVLFRQRRFNWLRSSVPETVLCDFGIARNLARRHALVIPAGTEDYMPPELFSQTNWNLITCSADVYMLGVVMYEMLTGRVPFENLGKKLDRSALPRPIQELNRSASPQLVQVVMTALEQNPVLRYSSAALMREALERIPLGMDGGMIMRQAATGLAGAGLVAGLIWGLGALPPSPGPTVTPSPMPPMVATTVAPSTPASTTTRAPTVRPSSTPMLTTTPRPTPVPPTYTSTVTP